MKQNNFAKSSLFEKKKQKTNLKSSAHKITQIKLNINISWQDYIQISLRQRRGNINWITKKGHKSDQTKVTFQLSNLLKLRWSKAKRNMIPLKTNSSNEREESERQFFLSFVNIIPRSSVALVGTSHLHEQSRLGKCGTLAGVISWLLSCFNQQQQ